MMELIAKIIQEALDCLSNPQDVTEIEIRQGIGQHWFVDVNNDPNIFIFVSWTRNYGLTSTVHEYQHGWAVKA